MSFLETLRFVSAHPLTHQHKLKAIARIARWQVGTRMLAGTYVYEWVNGSKFYVRRGETGLTGNIYVGLHEFPDMGFLLHFLRSEDFFADVGANVGSYSLLACAAIGARGIAFEPIPATCERLIQNLRLNNLDQRVLALNQGVGAAPGELSFTDDLDCTNHALATDEVHANAVSVPVTTLDTALFGRTPMLMKIDVEGYETPVLEGARATLADPSLRAVIMELNGSGVRYGYDEAHVLAVMLEAGFQTYAYDPLARTLTDLDGKNVDSGNTLFLRDLPFVRERLRTAQKVQVNGREF